MQIAGKKINSRCVFLTGLDFTNQAYVFNQSLESGLVTDGIVYGFAFDVNDFSGPCISCLFKPIDRLIFVTQSQINESNVESGVFGGGGRNGLLGGA